MSTTGSSPVLSAPTSDRAAPTQLASVASADAQALADLGWSPLALESIPLAGTADTLEGDGVAMRSLESLAQEFRVAARRDPGLRHVLVRFDASDPDWRHRARLDSADGFESCGTTFDPVLWWQAARLRGIVYNMDERPAESVSSLLNLISQVGTWAQRLGIPSDGSLDWWCRHLHRLAWSDRLGLTARRRFAHGDFLIDWDTCRVSAASADSVVQMLSMFEGPRPGTWFSILEPDLLSASAMATDWLVEAYRWRMASWNRLRPPGWFGRATGHGITQSMLTHARDTGMIRGVCSATGRWTYDAISVASHFVQYRSQLLEALESKKN